MAEVKEQLSENGKGDSQEIDPAGHGELSNVPADGNPVAGEDVGALLEKLRRMDQALSLAVARYREVVAAANPDIPAEMITGSTLEEIDRSVASSRQLIDRIKVQLERERVAGHVPPGSPIRGLPDLSGLSAREKIHHGIGERQGK